MREATVSLRARRGIAIGLAALGAVASVIGFLAIMAFDTAPGDAGPGRAKPPLTWPGGAGIERSPDRAQLLMFVHPFCGCTTASIAELERVPALWQHDSPAITFAVYRPDAKSTWKWSALAERTRNLPGVKVIWDDGGRTAQRFRAGTSGTVLLYSSHGDLLFHGGVTGSRGHEGDNYGIEALGQLLKSPPAREAAPVTSHVFGCALGGGE